MAAPVRQRDEAAAVTQRNGGTVIDARHRNTALLVAGCFFMEMLDGTIVTTASPQIGRSLHAPAGQVGLLVTAYLLTLAVLIPLSGWLTRRFGNRRVFLTAIAVFTLASVGCASSVSLGELVAMRVLQGAGGAMMVPVGRNMVMSTAAKEDLLRITSYVVWPGLLAPVIAPLAGGLLTTYASWHWIFLINAPLGVIAFGVAWRLVTGSGPGTAPPPLDWAGVVLTCVGLGGLTYAAHLLSLAAPPAAATTAFAAGSAAALAGAVWHLRRTAHPLLNLRTLRVDTFRVSQLGGSLYWLVVGAVPFLLPLLWQTKFGWSPVKSGALAAFIFVGNVGIKPATTPLINRFGFRSLLVASTVVMAVVMAALGFITAATPLPVIALLTLISGATRSAALTVYSTIGFADMPADRMRDASTLWATTSQLAAGLSVAFATVALRIGGLLPGAATSTSAYTLTFGLLAVISLAAAAEAGRLRPDAGDAARAGRPARAAAASEVTRLVRRREHGPDAENSALNKPTRARLW
jgi:EmrB/QacA subfamily drug resistance transporter